MSWFESVSPKSSLSASAKPIFDTAAMAQLGAMSPLWMLFISASTAGMAYWGMTRWMRLAVPERVAENVVKLRLVKSEPAPTPTPTAIEPAAELQVVAPELVVAEPVVTEVASVSVVMPEPVAEAAAVAAPEVVKVAPKPKAPKVLKTRTLKVSAPKITPPGPAPVAEKIPVRRGRPPKIKAEPLPAPQAVAQVETPVAKAPGAKRGPKPKIKA